jgi:glycosyltransferase involved in cell wall biosynthesis
MAANGAWKHSDGEIICTYVSNVDWYKHQWNVVEAVHRIRQNGVPIKLQLVGGGQGPARLKLNDSIAKFDINGEFVKLVEAVPHEAIPSILGDTDIFIFASSCENMPNTLVEAMASGLPIACSLRGPMPEVLKDAGVYFDPEDPASIEIALTALLSSQADRYKFAGKAKAISEQFSWKRCAAETWGYLKEVHDNLGVPRTN